MERFRRAPHETAKVVGKREGTREPDPNSYYTEGDREKTKRETRQVDVAGVVLAAEAAHAHAQKKERGRPFDRLRPFAAKEEKSVPLLRPPYGRTRPKGHRKRGGCFRRYGDATRVPSRSASLDSDEAGGGTPFRFPLATAAAVCSLSSLDYPRPSLSRRPSPHTRACAPLSADDYESGGPVERKLSARATYFLATPPLSAAPRCSWFVE